MDIAKYTMTAVILTSIFGEFSQKRPGETCPFLFTLSYAVAAAMHKMIIPNNNYCPEYHFCRGLFAICKSRSTNMVFLYFVGNQRVADSLCSYT